MEKRRKSSPTHTLKTIQSPRGTSKNKHKSTDRICEDIRNRSRHTNTSGKKSLGLEIEPSSIQGSDRKMGTPYYRSICTSENPATTFLQQKARLAQRQ